MIVNLFKTRQPGYYVFLTLLSMVVFLTGSEKPVVMAGENNMPLYRLLTSFSNPPETLYFITALLIFVLQGIQLHFLVNRFEVLYKPSFLPWLMFILLMSVIPGLLVFSPALLANSFLLLMLDRLFRIYKCDYAQGFHFEAAAMLSVAVCIYLPAVSLLLLFIAAMLLLHPFDWRNWASALLGFLTPVFLLSTVLFLADKSEMLWPDGYLNVHNISFGANVSLSASQKVTAVFILVIALLSILMLRENFYKNNSRTRSYQQVVILYGFITLILPFFTPYLPVFKFTLHATALAIVTGYYLLAVRKNWIADTILILLAVLGLFNHLKLPFVY